MSKWKLIYNGIVPGNPVFVLLLGMCATLGTTSSALNGLMMGLSTAAVLVCSNAVIAAVRNFIPDKVHIPAYIVIIATFVTLLQLAVSAWVPALNASLGIFIPLIVVNCILLGRAEAFAGKHNVIDSVCDGLGCGIGFILALTLPEAHANSSAPAASSAPSSTPKTMACCSLCSPPVPS